MIGWIISVLPLGWAVYQHFHPRLLCKLHYQISDIHEDNHPAKLTLANIYGVYSESHVSHQEYVNLTGKIIEIRSLGNHAAKGILIHLRMKTTIYYYKIETDERHENPYGDDGEFNIKIDCLNPTDVLRVIVLCDKALLPDDSDSLIEHRITLNEGKAKLVKSW